uniref:Uncharacterized protein n=1 Tax=Nelumbo nucifera TaxID=4432 RepID=A0A822Y9X9_NELNU|nr:TPA_asm: hypothetical protein HUJ06_030675 [Nelumbo nucifera]DAD29208.1 TPA_asm: hypothetical protein HUJ06_030676 [Nelumbo nucifera]
MSQRKKERRRLRDRTTTVKICSGDDEEERKQGIWDRNEGVFWVLVAFTCHRWFLFIEDDEQ